MDVGDKIWFWKGNKIVCKTIVSEEISHWHVGALKVVDKEEAFETKEEAVQILSPAARCMERCVVEAKRIASEANWTFLDNYPELVARIAIEIFRAQTRKEM